jgi:hypothetical protein
MVRDNVTGLIWEIKTTDGSVHDVGNKYYWCNSNLENPGYCSGDNTEGFIAILNIDKFGGFDDWRLPTIVELTTLVDSSHIDPALNNTYFPNVPSNTIAEFFWSSNIVIGNSYNAWFCDFSGSGGIGRISKSTKIHAIAIRGGNDNIAKYFSQNNNSTVTDTSTRLTWQQDVTVEANGLTGDGYITWEEALLYVSGLNSIKYGGYTDWRLPNRNELLSLVDYNLDSPAINTNLFPGPTTSYWTSTTEHGMNENAWTVWFFAGWDDNWSKNAGGYVRAVRGGGPIFTLSATKFGTGQGSLISSPAGINCGSDCSESYESGTIVSLTASPASGSIFAGWAGACSGTGPCVITMNSNISVSANFVNPSFVPTLAPIYYLLRENMP